MKPTTQRLRNPPKDILTQLKKCPALQQTSAQWHMDKAVFELIQQMAQKEKVTEDARTTRSR